MSRSAAGLGSGEKKNGVGAIDWIDGLMSEGPLGVEAGEEVAEFVVAGGGIKGNVVFRQRSDNAVAREHGRAFDYGSGTDSVDANFGREADGHFADEMADGGLADVVSLAAALGDDGVSGTGEDDGNVEVLVGEDFGGLIDEEMIGRDVD